MFYVQVHYTYRISIRLKNQMLMPWPLCPRYRYIRRRFLYILDARCLFFLWLSSTDIISSLDLNILDMTHKAISRYVSFFLAVRSIFFFFFGRRRRPRTPHIHGRARSLLCAVGFIFHLFVITVIPFFLSSRIYTM